MWFLKANKISQDFSSNVSMNFIAYWTVDRMEAERDGMPKLG